MAKNLFSNLLRCVIICIFFIKITHQNYLRKSIKNILYLTDIHLDLLYDSNSEINGQFITRCKNNENLETHLLKSFDYGRYSCNSNENLLKETLADIKKKFSDIDLIIIISPLTHQVTTFFT